MFTDSTTKPSPAANPGRMEATMKIKALVKLMNNHGTNPRIDVLHGDTILFAGKRENMDAEIMEMKVNSFTAVGAGHLKIYAE